MNWAVQNGVTNGYGEGTFSPNVYLTRAMAVTFIWNMEGSPKDDSLTEDFSDVEDGDWFSSAVKWAVSNGITSGYGTGTFQPYTECTRAMAVTFLKNYAEYKGVYVEAETENNFSDVSESDWFSESVSWAYENGITSGYGAGTFKPYVNCTRAMMATYLYNYNNALAAA